jgi:hypothetical protein
MARANLNKSEIWSQILSQHQIEYLRGPESVSIKIPPSNQYLLCKSTSKCEHCELRFTSQKTVFENFDK